MIRAERPRRGAAIAVVPQDGMVSLAVNGQFVTLTAATARQLADALHDGADEVEAP